MHIFRVLNLVQVALWHENFKCAIVVVLAYFRHLVYLGDICDKIAKKKLLQLESFLCDTCCLSQSISTISYSLSDMCDAFDVFEVHLYTMR